MTPLADAVRFVDRHQRALDVGDHAAEQAVSQTLWGYVRDAVLAAAEAPQAIGELGALESRGEIGRAHAPLGEGLDLIVHQRDEGRDDQRGSRKQRRRELIHEALSAPGGRHEQHLSPGEEGLNRVLLPRAKRGVSEALEASLEIEHGGFSRHVRSEHERCPSDARRGGFVSSARNDFETRPRPGCGCFRPRPAR